MAAPQSKSGLVYASAVAALSVLQPGAAPAMPIAREIARFLKKRDHS